MSVRPPALTRAAYWQDLDNARYRLEVEQRAASLQSDGCSCVPDWHVIACWDHDIAYRTHRDVFGNRLIKPQADDRFLWAMQHEDRLGRGSPRAWARWLAVTIFGDRAWDESTGTMAIVHPGTLRQMFRR